MPVQEKEEISLIDIFETCCCLYKDLSQNYLSVQNRTRSRGKVLKKKNNSRRSIMVVHSIFFSFLGGWGVGGGMVSPDAIVPLLLLFILERESFIVINYALYGCMDGIHTSRIL